MFYHIVGEIAIVSFSVRFHWTFWPLILILLTTGMLHVNENSFTLVWCRCWWVYFTSSTRFVLNFKRKYYYLGTSFHTSISSYFCTSYYFFSSILLSVVTPMDLQNYSQYYQRYYLSIIQCISWTLVITSMNIM